MDFNLTAATLFLFFQVTDLYIGDFFPHFCSLCTIHILLINNKLTSSPPCALVCVSVCLSFSGPWARNVEINTLRQQLEAAGVALLSCVTRGLRRQDGHTSSREASRRCAGSSPFGLKLWRLALRRPRTSNSCSMWHSDELWSWDWGRDFLAFVFFYFVFS